MDLSNLKPAEGSVKKTKRIGRGQGSGHGGTSTRGHKGAQSRSGYTKRAGFEGGQMPLQRRTPKRGFKNPFRVEYTGLNLGRLQTIAEKYKVDTITVEWLQEHKIISKNERVKILGGGALKGKLTLSAHAVSESAKKAIESIGGTINLI